MNRVSPVIIAAIECAYYILPDRMRSPEASAMLIAIGLQESRFKYRRQIMGPARGYWQFECEGGVKGVLLHPSTREHAATVLSTLNYPTDTRPQSRRMLHQSLADNDVLAAAFARLLLYSDSRPLPRLTDAPEVSWGYYLDGWRPGRPHRQTWDGFWNAAISEVS